MRKVLIVSIIFYAITALVYFLCAGRLDLPLAWCYFLVTASLGLCTVAIAESKSTGFAQERLRPAPGEQDRVFKPVGTICTFAVLVIAGLDVCRFHWAPAVTWQLQLAALILAVGGLVLVCWAMLVNSFFSSAVRLQPDRGQVLVRSGPYAIVRHPGYAGGILYIALSGLALGSWWAGIAALPIIYLTLRRTVLEDAMLQSGLAGYAEYSRQVPDRLLPRIW
jgi:protein-S-isoprenylcysteine O-methyltransferase Ste14